MRKLTLIVMTAVFAVTSAFAEGKVSLQRIKASDFHKQTAAQQQKQSLKLRENSSAYRMFMDNMQKKSLAPLRIAEEGPITQQPAGQESMGFLSYQGVIYNWLYGWMPTSEETGVTKLVDGTDGNLYVQYFVPGTPYWAKAEKVDGNNYEVKRQVLYSTDYNGQTLTYEVAKLIGYEFEEDGELYIGYDIADEPIKFTYDGKTLAVADEELIVDEPLEEFPLIAIGYIACLDGELAEFDGFYVSNTYTKISDAATKVPAGAEVKDMILKYTDLDSYQGIQVPTAIVGNTFYFLPFADCPDGWVKGTINGKTITVKSEQFLGVNEYYGCYDWAYGGNVYLNEEDGKYYTNYTDQIVLDYDAETGTITAQDPMDALFITDKTYLDGYFIDPSFYFFKLAAAVPTDPEPYYFYDYDEAYGDAEFIFYLYNVDQNGDFILPERMSYAVYVDDEIFEAEPDEYPELEETMTTYPYDFDGGPIYNGGTYRYFFLYFQPAERIGVQAFYRANQYLGKSNIVYYNVNTGEIEVETDSSLPGPLGIEDATAAKQVVAEAYVDAQGRQVAANAKGFVIKTITFADGTKKSYKVVRK